MGRILHHIIQYLQYRRITRRPHQRIAYIDLIHTISEQGYPTTHVPWYDADLPDTRAYIHAYMCAHGYIYSTIPTARHTPSTDTVYVYRRHVPTSMATHWFTYISRYSLLRQWVRYRRCTHKQHPIHRP